MRKETIKRFKKLFEAEKQKIQNEKIIREDFSVSSDDRLDELDQATTDVEQSMRMRFANRGTLYLKKIEDALRRIEDETFGECLECEEPIELKRLEARPITDLCISCKEEQERRESITVAGREQKSLGESLSRRYA